MRPHPYDVPLFLTQIPTVPPTIVRTGGAILAVPISPTFSVSIPLLDGVSRLEFERLAQHIQALPQIAQTLHALVTSEDPDAVIDDLKTLIYALSNHPREDADLSVEAVLEECQAAIRTELTYGNGFTPAAPELRSALDKLNLILGEKA